VLLVLLILLLEKNCTKKWKRRDWACGIFATTFKKGNKKYGAVP